MTGVFLGDEEPQKQLLVPFNGEILYCMVCAPKMKQW